MYVQGFGIPWGLVGVLCIHAVGRMFHIFTIIAYPTIFRNNVFEVITISLFQFGKILTGIVLVGCHKKVLAIFAKLILNEWYIFCVFFQHIFCEFEAIVWSYFDFFSKVNSTINNIVCFFVATFLKFICLAEVFEEIVEILFFYSKLI